METVNKESDRFKHHWMGYLFGFFYLDKKAQVLFFLYLWKKWNNSDLLWISKKLVVQAPSFSNLRSLNKESL